jgi:signal transduction histidine kinase
MLAKLPLRSKLIMVVSIPLFVILGFATFGMAARMSDLDAQRQYSRLREPNDALTSVAADLESEGVLTTWVNAGHAPDVVARLNRARKATNDAVDALAGSGAALAEGGVAPGTLDSWRTLVGRLHATIGPTRREVDAQTAAAATAGTTYLDLSSDTLGVSELVARDLSNRDLSASMLGLVDLRREQLDSAHEAEIVLPYVVTRQSDQLTNWISAITAQRADVARFRAAATPAARAAFDKARSTPPPDDLMRSQDANALPSAFPKTQMSPDFYFSVWQAKEAYLGHGVAAVQAVTDAKASALESAALSGVLWYGLGVSGLVLLVLILTWITIRSVNKSLRALTEAARDVAETRLPHLVDTLGQGGEIAPGTLDLTPIKVTSKDELGELATAFNTIQRVAVAVAEEQSALLRKGIGDLYVNLARRNQSLLDRQIALLDDMEARAEDSDYLGALFELDHLATRMRRNAESLLVMSGAEQPRQWHESIPMLDVVRAATAEITDFARVGYYGFEGEVAIAGNAVADVTHLLAELFENATVFSPPGTPVVVTGMRAERRYVISIADEGIGMTDERLAAANALLMKPPATGLALSRTLGLHVVANLATRYGITVQLRRSATGGITAIVALPAKVLARLPRSGGEPDPDPSSARSEGAVRAEPVDLDPLPSHGFDRELEPAIEGVAERPVFEPVFEPVIEGVVDGPFGDHSFGSPAQPVFDQPVFDQPVFDQPVFDQPVFDQDIDDRMYDEPVSVAGTESVPAAPPTQPVAEAAGRAAPSGNEALIFTPDAVFVGSAAPEPAPETVAPSQPITWQPVFAADGTVPPPPPQVAQPTAAARPAPPPPAEAMAPSAGVPTAPTATPSAESTDDVFAGSGGFRADDPVPFADGPGQSLWEPSAGHAVAMPPVGQPTTPLSRRVPGAAFSPPSAGANAGADNGAGGTRTPGANGGAGGGAPAEPSVPADGPAPSLAHRTPGKHLSHKPAPPTSPRLDGEPRPRPERVHDLLARHLRGIREGRTGVAHADDHADPSSGAPDRGMPDRGMPERGMEDDR